MWKTLKDVDPLVFFLIIALLTLGTVMVYSSGAIFAADRYGDEWFFLERQVLWLGIGLVAMVGAAATDYRAIKRWTYPLFFGVCALLILVLIPGVGSTVGGATRWLRLGGLQVQPSEFAKLALLVYLAYSLEKKQSHIETFSVGILPHLLLSGLMLGLIVIEPDFGTTVTLGALLFLMMFVAGVRLLHIVLLFSAALPIAVIGLFAESYRVRRLTAFLDPWEHAQDEAFQLIQSMLAFRAGGLGGAGLGESRQKLFFLPEAHTDFIFAVVGEELGLGGVLLVIGLFCALVWRAIYICLHAPDPFGRLLGIGLAMLMAMQAGINMGVVMGVLPTKGLTLPFVSYGGSSLVLTMLMSGILLNITAQARSTAISEAASRNPFRTTTTRLPAVRVP